MQLPTTQIMVQQRSTHILIIHDTQGHREYILDGPTYVIGRDPKCDIRLASQFVSRVHATLAQMWNDDDTPYYRIIDGKPRGKASANGLMINGQKVTARDLKAGDEIIFGPQASATYCLRDHNEEQPDIPTIDTAIYSLNE